ncbi:MAG TPA: fibrinogen-like YCDxxxxGGGW domain-containing protein [Acidimicrobiia bacterium]
MLRRSVSAALTLGLVGIGLTAAVTLPAHAGSPTVHKGLTSTDAAPSCWAIKQSFPSSASGIYWLQTASLVAPQPFYCDMTTDGGGWVLVGRGRTGWKWQEVGQGTAAALRTTITGPNAFAPSALSQQVVNGLLGGTRPDALPDGVRVVRATNTAGTTSQEVRWHLTNTSQWSWEFAGGEPLASLTYGAQSATSAGYASTTSSSGFDNGWNRAMLDTGNPNYLQTGGFAYGAQIAGNASASSYLAPGVNGSGAIPFTQVWIRPKLDDSQAGFATVPDSGTAAQTLSWLPQNAPQTFHWGVVGVQKVADPDPDNDAPAHTLVQVGNEMFVGGKFAAVQNGAGGAQYNQPWLAAFDVQTGTWISTFRPRLDGEVFSLAAAPNGDLIVAGDFTNVNGAPHTSGLAELDPTTGQVVSSFTAYVTSPRFGATRPYVRTVAVAGNWLYVGGGFNRLIGGPTLFTVVPEGLGRVRLSDGTPDRTWKVATDLPVVDVYPSQDGTRVYAAGFFHNVDNTPGIDGVAVLDATSGALVPGMNRPQFDQGNQHRWYQYTIFEDGNYVYIGGGKHELQEYTRSSFSWVTGHVEQWHGDFQVAHVYNGVIIAGCHCDVYDYSSTDSYPTPTNYSQVAPASWLMAFSPNGLTNLTDFAPQIGMSSAGEGIWGITLDSYGCVWAAGDIVRGAVHNGAYDWLGGFARFCSRDTSAPTAPKNVKAAGTTLSWGASTDNSGAAPQYEVIRNDRVITTTTTTNFVVPGPGRYFVRAVDAAGNRSASTLVTTI